MRTCCGTGLLYRSSSSPMRNPSDLLPTPPLSLPRGFCSARMAERMDLQDERIQKSVLKTFEDAPSLFFNPLVPRREGVKNEKSAN